MKPFNLKEALDGKPVVTRTGDAVTQLYLFDCDDDLPLMGVLHNELHSFTKDGKWSTYDNDKRDTDLFMAPEKKSIWVNFWKTENNTIFTSSHNREDQADLEIENKLNSKHIKKIEIEL
jgi:hypothetical protein